tara:strand:+ start:10252 stop:13470 length:3219 start_codon:yes stop_codon:yes gene_type:complete
MTQLQDAAKVSFPEPKRRPFVGNLLELDQDKPAQSFARIAEKLGPVYKFHLPGVEIVVLSRLKQLEEAFDQERFEKAMPKALDNLRALALDGLFTSYNDEPNWGKAHRVLMPAFGMQSMRRYHGMMLDVATQMVDKWARLPNHHSIDVASDMTRLTLDVIALCGFGYRFNSFYMESMHPFVDSMVRSLQHAMHTSHRPDFINHLMFQSNRTFVQDIEYMHKIVDDVIAERKTQQDQGSKDDLLSLMLNAIDPETGETLSDENIRYQIVTFLIAGHETTSSLLAFALYFLMRHPEVIEKARKEVDSILLEPGQLPTFEETKNMRYLEQILFESLRLYPTAPAFALKPKVSTAIDGYPIDVDNVVLVNLSGLHRDPEVWDDPDSFIPERFAPEAVKQRSPHAWKPFGNGMRACIGRQFAIHEAKLVLSLILKRFELRDLNPDAPLDVREMLTFKPQGLMMRVRLRDGLRAEQQLQRRQSTTDEPQQEEETDATPVAEPHGTPLTVAYGSNMGSTKFFAQQLARDATRLGYDVTLCSLNDCVENIPTEGAFFVVSASYNGHAPDNANRFCDWLSNCKEGSLEGVQFSVFGCGHKDWAATYQAIPTMIDEALERAGGVRLFARGEGDAREDIESDVKTWKGAMWPAVQTHFSLPSELPSELLKEDTLTVEELTPPPRQQVVPDDACPMQVVENKELVDMSWPFSRSKRHLRITLPEDVSYEAGDYLVIQPVNDTEEVEAFARHLGWDLEQIVILRNSGAATLPLNRPLSLRSLLTRYVELRRPITQGQLRALVEHTACPPEREKLRRWSDTGKEGQEAFQEHVGEKLISLYDLVQMFPSMKPGFDVVLSMLHPLQPRYYSIASSSLASPGACDLIVSVLEQPASSGQGQFKGVCSNYLARVSEGDSVLAWVKRPNPSFAPPEDVSKPMILIGAGTGFAPFRGFLQERSVQSEQSDCAKSMLFFGCDHPEVDFLYEGELREWAEQELVSVFPAFSEKPDGDVMFVQHRLWQERELVKTVLDEAVFYICGDGRYMAPAVIETLCRIYAEKTGCSTEEAEDWLRGMRHSGRLYEDVWAG